jgi:uncharacterized surface protein with fasciclin (FAS1) repeats
MTILRTIALTFVAALLINTTFAQEKPVMVGGAAMYPSKNIVENAINSKDHTTLVAAVKAAGLVETLESAGPFTVSLAYRRGFRYAAQRHGRDAGQAGKQG